MPKRMFCLEATARGEPPTVGTLMTESPYEYVQYTFVATPAMPRGPSCPEASITGEVPVSGDSVSPRSSDDAGPPQPAIAPKQMNQPSPDIRMVPDPFLTCGLPGAARAIRRHRFHANLRPCRQGATMPAVPWRASYCRWLVSCVL